MKRYGVIYMDPPWMYSNKKTGGSMKSGAVQKYPAMTIPELQKLPILDIAEKDCVLFMWSVTPLLPEAVDLLRHYGFKFKTFHVWDKERYGMGFNFRVQTEVLLVGWRGKWKPFRLTDRNIHRERPTQHSRKPQYYRDMIVRAVPSVRRVELFARRPPDELWDVWGNEAEGSIDFPINRNEDTEEP